jgi:hypothetical protein
MEIPTPNVENRQLSKAELKMKLRNKIASFKNHQPANRQAISEKEYNKMMREAKLEMQKLQKDDRVKPRMIELYKKTCNEFKNVTIPTPIEMLNNPEDARIKLREYYTMLINSCRENNISREKFISDYLNSVYTQYHVEVLGIECVPEKLRPDVLAN